MKVILLEKTHKLGNLGETVQVKPGYGRNYLIPKGKAVFATPENIKKFEAKRAELEKQAAEVLAAAQKRAEAFKDLTLTMVRKVREEDKLFGSVTINDVIDALSEKELAVEKREIDLTSGPIHELGEYNVELHLHTDVIVPVKVVVEAEQ